MAEKVIEGKKFKVEETLYTTRTIGKENAGKFSPPEGKSSATIIVSAQITKEDYDNLVATNSELAYTKNGEYYLDYAKIEGNEFTFLRDEDFGLRSDILQQIKQNSIDDSKLAVESSNLTNGSNTQPNVASTNTQTQEVSSTPVATGLGQGVRFDKTGSKKTKTVLVYPINMDDSQDCMEFVVYKYAKRGIDKDFTRLDAFGTSNGKIVNENYTTVENTPTVFLPVTKISDNNSVSWQDDTLNEFQRFFANSSLKIMQPGAEGNSLDTAFNMATMAAEYAKESGPFGNYMRSLAAGLAVGTNNLLSRTASSILNPNMELLFNNPQLRQFQFSFDLIAKSKEEATEIKQIIRFFKKNMAVRAGGAIGDAIEKDGLSFNEGNSVFLSSPYLFRLRYLAGSVVGSKKPHQSIGQIKMCALQNFTTDYTPMNTYMTFNDEARTMFMYRLSMSFKELTPLYDTDYIENKNDDNYHPIGF
jgi:hypothetical protein